VNLRRFVLALTVVTAGGLAWFLSLAKGHRPVPRRQPDVVKVGFQVGERAPDFALRSLNGVDLRLSNLQGRPVLLNFWATWCAPCRVEMPWLAELDATYRSHGVQIIGVAMESGSPEEVAAFAREHGVQYQVVLGNSETADEYGGVRFMPQSFFIDPEGKITKTTTGLTDRRDIEDGIKALLTGNSKAPLARGGRP